LKIHAGAACVVLCLILSGAVSGQEISTQTGDVTFGGPEAAALLRAVDAIDTSPNITISIVGKEPGEMPKTDPFFHYAGLDPKKQNGAIIWMSHAVPDKPTADIANQLRAAEELAVMDTGFAGPKWKAVYDYLAGLDAKLPSGAGDPYRSRHKLTAEIQSIIDSYSK
jgi:hypothetical protein